MLMLDLGSLLREHGIGTQSLRRMHDDGQPESESDSYSLQVAGSEAVAGWSVLRNIVDKTGYWPVLLGGDADLAHHSRAIGDSSRISDFDQMLADTRALDAEAWLHARLGRLRQKHPEVLDDLHEEWPSDIDHDDTFSIPNDPHTAGLRTTCYLGLVPTRASWQLPLLLRFGGWNDCPAPAEHASVLARWERMYGAEIVGMTRDTLELSVGNPPDQREAALDLALEQFAYCTDVVVQGTLTIERLAATLLDGRVWFFWWD
jgi:hypothetical protein